MPRSTLVFFFNDTPTTEIYTLSLHDALPISRWDEPAPPSLDLPPAPGRKSVPPPASGRPSAGPPAGGRPPITGALAETHDVDEILEAPVAPRTSGSEPPTRGPSPPEAAGDGRSPRSSGAR